MNENYQKSVDILTSQGKFHICLGLDRISNILGLMGNPQDDLKIIHVAGTNGKGSVCSILSNILCKAGYKVGLYTSPHLFEYTERIKINNIDIPKEIFAQYVIDICELAHLNSIHLTEFEILTAVAYKYYSDEKIDIAIIETGLGGRLDATNVISSNLLSIITSISIDHIDRLGDTIEKIAFEKAGIIKPNSNIVVSENNMGFKVISEVAKRQGAEISTPQAKVELLFENYTNHALINNKKYEFALLGLWQKDNLELVVEALRSLKAKGFTITDEAVKEGLKTVLWPARMQYVKDKNILIDGAHNLDGAKQLLKSIEYYFPDKKRVWLYGSLDTKEYSKIVSLLFKEGDDIYFYEFNNKNSVKFEDIKKHVKKEIKMINYSKAANMSNYYDDNCLIIISGSFYMIGEIFNTLSL